MKTQTMTHNLMSFTGFKSLLLFSSLLESPKTFEEIKERFREYEFLKENISIDTLRVYINSLERIGCEIVRDKKSEGGKYRLLKHPFEINLTEEQAKSIVKIYKNIVKNIEVEDLLYLTNFFNKIAKNIDNIEIKETIENLSPLNKIDEKILKELIAACRKKEEITILYNSPNSSKKEIDVLTDKLYISNNKVYLSGFSNSYKNTARFLVSRIIDIIAVKLTKTIINDTEPQIITCEIYDKDIELLKNEKIISNNEDKMIIEIKSNNDFITKQRVLSLGSSCKVISPQSFKDDIVYTLNKIREGYIGEKI